MAPSRCRAWSLVALRSPAAPAAPISVQRPSRSSHRRRLYRAQAATQAPCATTAQSLCSSSAPVAAGSRWASVFPQEPSLRSPARPVPAAGANMRLREAAFWVGSITVRGSTLTALVPGATQADMLASHTQNVTGDTTTGTATGLVYTAASGNGGVTGAGRIQSTLERKPALRKSPSPLPVQRHHQWLEQPPERRRHRHARRQHRRCPIQRRRGTGCRYRCVTYASGVLKAPAVSATNISASVGTFNGSVQLCGSGSESCNFAADYGKNRRNPVSGRMQVCLFR